MTGNSSRPRTKRKVETTLGIAQMVREKLFSKESMER